MSDDEMHQAKSNIRNIIETSQRFTLDELVEMWYGYTMDSMRQAYDLGYAHGIESGVKISMPTYN